MAKTGRSYSSKRSPNHLASEAARLREMVRAREEQIEQLREKLSEIRALVDRRKEGSCRSHETETMLNMIQGILDRGGDDQ